jgi:hypothetical protein
LFESRLDRRRKTTHVSTSLRRVEAAYATGKALLVVDKVHALIGQAHAEHSAEHHHDGAYLRRGEHHDRPRRDIQSQKKRFTFHVLCRSDQLVPLHAKQEAIHLGMQSFF